MKRRNLVLSIAILLSTLALGSVVAPGSKTGKGGSSPLTTKGDIYGFGTADCRVAVGTTGQYMTADSTQTCGVKWSTPGAGSGNVTSINTDATAVQTLTTGTTGTDFAIVDNASGDHKFNIPDAGASARGLVTTGTQTLAGAKTLSSTLSLTATTDSLDLVGGGGGAGKIAFKNAASSGHFNWMVGAQVNLNNMFEITPSTAADGTTFSNPALIIDKGGTLTLPTSNSSLILQSGGGGAGEIQFKNPASSGKYNWHIGAQLNASNAFEITPSTSVDGNSFTSPLLQLFQNGTLYLTGSIIHLNAGGTATTNNSIISTADDGSTSVGGGSGTSTGGVIALYGHTSATPDVIQLINNNSASVTIGATGVVNINGLTASKPVLTDASKNLVSANVNLASMVTGNLPVANLNSGTNADSSHYWRGDGTWATVAGSGTVTSVAMTVPTFLSISGSPVTTSGTLAVSLSGSALPIANGGTNSTTALNSNRFMVSSSGSIVEAGAVTASRVIVSDTNGLPSANAMTTTVLADAVLREWPGFIESPANKTYVITGSAPTAGTITGAWFETVSGTLTAAVKINGANVTSLSAVSVSSTGASTSATGTNTFSAGDKITLVVSSGSSPVDFDFSIKYSVN